MRFAIFLLVAAVATYVEGTYPVITYKIVRIFSTGNSESQFGTINLDNASVVSFLAGTTPGHAITRASLDKKIIGNSPPTGLTGYKLLDIKAQLDYGQAPIPVVFRRMSKTEQQLKWLTKYAEASINLTEICIIYKEEPSQELELIDTLGYVVFSAADGSYV